jgi:hypothetical protein
LRNRRESVRFSGKLCRKDWLEPDFVGIRRDWAQGCRQRRPGLLFTRIKEVPMKRPLPTGAELAVFAVVALTCAALAALTRAHDIAMAAFALPIFIVAAWMGMRRSGQWAAIAQVVKPTTAAVVEETVEEEAAV